MPTRFLKESICTSETLAKLSPEEERAFYRLLVNCDDFGRTDARPAILRAHMFPLSVDTISLDDIRRWMQALQDADLIKVYMVKWRPYLEVVTWKSYQNQRANNSRWPDPLEGESVQFASIGMQPHTDESNCTQIPANAPVLVSRTRISSLESRISTCTKTDENTTADADAPSGATEPATRPKKEPTKSPGPQAAMFTALQEEYGEGREDIPLNDSERLIFGKVARELVKSDLSPPDVHKLRENIRTAYPNLGTIPPTMLPKYVYLLRNPPRPTNGSRAVDRSSLSGTVDYAKLHDLKQEREGRSNGEATRAPG